MRAAPLLIGLAVTTGCPECYVEPLDPETTQIKTDVLAQRGAARVDVLWMSDNSPTMQAEQARLADRFSDFFGALLVAGVDYHIGVITQDSDEGGVLRRYTGPAVPGCDDGCRVLTSAVPCDDPTVSIAGLDESAAEARLLDACPAALVFRHLIRTGAGDAVFEEGFVQVAQALGVDEVDPETGEPVRDVPAENAGFLRDDASLYVVFVSDEDESAREDGAPVVYYQRLFEGLKGAGNENKVTVAAITGWPIDGVPVGDVCSILATTYDTTVANDDARAQVVLDAMRSPDDIGCVDQTVASPSADDHAETGGRYIELACRTGGVIANICEDDYSAALDAMGADAAGLARRFALSRPANEIEWGADCIPFTEDDVALDCDDDGSQNGDVDGPLCVRATAFGDDTEQLLPQRADTWHYELATSSVRFDGAFLPQPGTEVHVTYRVHDGPCS